MLISSAGQSTIGNRRDKKSTTPDLQRQPIQRVVVNNIAMPLPVTAILPLRTSSSNASTSSSSSSSSIQRSTKYGPSTDSYSMIKVCIICTTQKGRMSCFCHCHLSRADHQSPFILASTLYSIAYNKKPLPTAFFFPRSLFQVLLLGLDCTVYLCDIDLDHSMCRNVGTVSTIGAPGMGAAMALNHNQDTLGVHTGNGKVSDKEREII